MQHYQRAVAHARLQIGVATADITPPVGVFNRCWGAAEHETAAGIHRPLAVTLWFIKGSETSVLVGMDGSWWQSKQLELRYRESIANAAGIKISQVLLCLSHTHAAVPLTDDAGDVPGGDILSSYASALPEKLAALCKAARNNLKDSLLQCGYGTCDLASLRDECRDGQWVVGSDVEAAADNTLLVGRVYDQNDKLQSVLVNYACHPTTLAWDNTLISPDYIGAMREQLEQVYGVPVMFVLGACGDLAPRRQYTGDTEIADSNGRQLAFAVQAAIEALPAAGHKLAATDVVCSGADLGCWEAVADQSPSQDLCVAQCTNSDMPWREDFPTIEALERDLQTADGAIAERLRRRLRIRRTVDKNGKVGCDIMSARFGDILFAGTPGEPFSSLQLNLRKANPAMPVIVANHCNGGSGYLMPEACYERTEFYAATQTPYAKGSFEKLTARALQALRQLTEQQLTERNRSCQQQ